MVRQSNWRKKLANILGLRRALHLDPQLRLDWVDPRASVEPHHPGLRARTCWQMFPRSTSTPSRATSGNSWPGSIRLIEKGNFPHQNEVLIIYRGTLNSYIDWTTVKPVLTTMLKLWTTTTLEQRPLFWVPRVAVVHRFDCIFFISFTTFLWS